MDWAANRAKAIFGAYLGLGVCFLIVRFIQVSGSWREWSKDAGMALFMAVFGFFAVWLIVGAQVELRGMDPIVRGACAFFFYMFALCTVWSLAVAAYHPEYWGTAAISCLGWSIGALHAYVRYRHTPPKGARRNLTTG